MQKRQIHLVQFDAAAYAGRQGDGKRPAQVLTEALERFPQIEVTQGRVGQPETQSPQKLQYLIFF